MTIKLITKYQHSLITEIYNKYPVLILQNKGYETITKELTEDEKKAKNLIAEILSEHIKGYSSFTNLRTSRKESKIELRFQYNYSEDDPQARTSFTGVGYILLDELLNGFK